MYHRFSDFKSDGKTSSESFERQVRYIKRFYKPYSLTELIQHYRRNGKYPEKAIVITVDDGYRDFYTCAYPILKAHGVSATLFATTGFVNRDLWLWPDKISWLLDRAKSLPMEFLADFPYVKDLSSSGEVFFKSLWSKWVAHALALSDGDKLEFIDSLARSMGLSFPDDIPAEYEPVSWNELNEIQDAGIEIGGHTVTHPSLGRVSHKQAEYEIFTSFSTLCERLGRKERTFCYPNGQPCDFNEYLPSIVERAGYIGAVTAFPDSVGLGQRYLMRRHGSGDDMFQFYKAVNGVELLGLRARRKVRLHFSGEECSRE